MFNYDPKNNLVLKLVQHFYFIKGLSAIFGQLRAQYTTQHFVQLFSATVGGTQLKAELSVWGFLIGSHQQLLQTVARCVGYRDF